MKLRGWITLGLVLGYGLVRSEVIAQANGTFLAQLAPDTLWTQWSSLLTSSSIPNDQMLLLASGAFLLGMLGVWWQPIMSGIKEYFRTDWLGQETYEG